MSVAKIVKEKLERGLREVPHLINIERLEKAIGDSLEITVTMENNKEYETDKDGYNMGESIWHGGILEKKIRLKVYDHKLVGAYTNEALETCFKRGVVKDGSVESYDSGQSIESEFEDDGDYEDVTESELEDMPATRLINSLMGLSLRVEIEGNKIIPLYGKPNCDPRDTFESVLCSEDVVIPIAYSKEEELEEMYNNLKNIFDSVRELLKNMDGKHFIEVNDMGSGLIENYKCADMTNDEMLGAGYIEKIRKMGVFFRGMEGLDPLYCYEDDEYCGEDDMELMDREMENDKYCDIEITNARWVQWRISKICNNKNEKEVKGLADKFINQIVYTLEQSQLMS